MPAIAACRFLLRLTFSLLPGRLYAPAAVSLLLRHDRDNMPISRRVALLHIVP